MATFVNDTFTDTNGTALTSHTGETGATWTLNSGTSSVTPTISGNKCLIGSDGFGAYYASGSPGSADYSATLTVVHSASNDAICAAVRMATAADTMYIVGNVSGQFMIIRRVAGTAPALAAVTPSGGLNTSEAYLVTASAVGSTISGRVQRSSDSQYLTSAGAWSSTPQDFGSVTDTGISGAGKAGFFAFQGSGATIDNFSADDAGGSGSFTVTPSTISDEDASETLTLAGTNTTWVGGGSEFSVSGLSGVSKVSESVSSTTAATLVVETVGGATGTLTITDGDGVTQTVTVEAAAPVTIDVTDANVFFSPYNWYSNGAGSMGSNNVNGSSTYVQANTSGAYVRLKVAAMSGTGYVNVGTPSSATVRYCIDDGAWQTGSVSAGQISLGSLAVATHDIEILVEDVGTSDRWTSPSDGLKITGFQFPAGTTTSTPTLRTGRMVIYGDSITEGAGASLAARLGWARLFAQAMNVEFGILGYQSQGWSQSGGGNVPAFSAAWDDYSNGRSRLVGGLLSPAPDHIVCNHGRNGSFTTGTVNTWLTDARAAAPDAAIVLVTTFDGTSRATITAATLPDANCYLVDMGTVLDDNIARWSADSVHPNQEGAANLAALVAAKVQEEISSGTGTAYSFGTFGSGRL